MDCYQLSLSLSLSLTLGGKNIFLYIRENAVFTISMRFDAKYLPSPCISGFKTCGNPEPH